MVLNKILFTLIISLFYNAQGIIISYSYSEHILANSLNVARNVSVEFYSGSYASNPVLPSIYPATPTIEYWTTQSTESLIKYTPPIWIQATARTTARPTEATLPYIPAKIPSTTEYMPPCWTQTTPGMTTTPTLTTPWYTPPYTDLTTNYIPPCWTQTIPEITKVTQQTDVTPPPRTTVYPGLENFACEERNHFYSVPNECDTFIECKENVARKHFCPEGLVYKPSTIWPDYPCVLTSEYQCLNGSITQPARPSAQCPHQDGYYPVPDSDCSQYIVCEHGIAILMNCPTGLVFNVEKSICDWPSAVPSCHPNALRDFTCPAEEDSEADVIYNYRYHSSCTYFVACQKGFSRLLSCPGGLRFDINKQTCIDESYVTDCET